MKKWIIFIAGIIIVALIILGINIFNTIEPIINSAEPQIRGVSLSWGKVTTSTTEINGTVIVYNPNTVPIPITRITCDMMINDIKVGTGETLGLQIKENSEFPVQISAIFDNTKFANVWAEHIKRGENSEISIKLGISVDLDIGTITIPYTIEQSFKTDLLANLVSIEPATVEKTVKVPILGEKTIFKLTFEGLTGTWGTATTQSSEINLSAIIYNENPYPLLVPKVKCTVESNGIIIAYGETSLLNALGSGSIEEVEVVANLNTSLMNEWFVRHIQQSEKSEFVIRIFMGFEVDEKILDILGRDDLSITLWEGDQIVETDILGQKS